jgi:Mg-chelatase subunit ChlD
VEEAPGLAVAIVIDNSGSMEDTVPGDQAPKYLIAQSAVQEMLAVTDSFVASRPDYPVKLTIFHFAGEAFRLMPIQPYDADEVRRAVEGIPFPDGATAIGDAMGEARRELYRSGTFRKHIVVITDGDNTSGRSPWNEAREIQRRSGGAVQLYVVAFDTDPDRFAFVDLLGGAVVAARDAPGLREGLKSLYEERILAEVEPGR